MAIKSDTCLFPVVHFLIKIFFEGTGKEKKTFPNLLYSFTYCNCVLVVTYTKLRQSTAAIPIAISYHSIINVIKIIK